jgi:hypothetical protein
MILPFWATITFLSRPVIWLKPGSPERGMRQGTHEKPLNKGVAFSLR